MPVTDWSDEMESVDDVAPVGAPMAEDYESTPSDYDADEVERSQAWVDGGMQLMEIEDFMFRLLADDLPDSICVFQPDGRIVWVNRAWLAIPGEQFDLTVEDIAGHRLEDLLFEPHYEEALRLRWDAIQSLTPERNLVMQQFPISETRSQQIVYKGWFLEGVPILYVGVGRDHSVAQQVEARLRESMRRLAESNRDLEDFAYVASHDLQEPLRKIIAFTDRLRATVGELDDKPADYLDRVQNASERMQRLIDDLLTFSRVSTRGQAFEGTDLEGVVAGVLGDLEVLVADTRAQIEVDALPTIEADPTQMRQLFQNLIGNALKFRRPDVAPEVRVRVERLVDHVLADGDEPRDCWHFTVSDNGIGFDEKYAQKIFTVFQRLHGRGEYQGSGIGLSVCRRIVERHDGQITAHSGPGLGATFEFVLPEQVSELIT